MPAPTAPSQPIPGPPTGARAFAPGVIDFYRSVAVISTDAARRYRLPLVSELALIGLYFVLRSIVADESALALWLGLAVGLCFVSPHGGLVVLAAVAPFNEGLLLVRDVGSKTVIAAALVLAIGLRWLVDPAARSRPSLPVVLAAGLVGASGLGLVRTAMRWDRDFALSAAGTWLQGIATMLLVFLAAVWIARRGGMRPLIAAMAGTTVAGLISLVDFWGDAAIRDTAIGWALVGEFNPSRLTGVIRSPTSTAALVMLPLSVYLAAVVLGPSARVRVAAAGISVPLLAAAYLTYNRAVFIALWAFAVVVGWRIGRRLGVALLVGGIILGTLFVPWYLSIRGQALGGGSQLEPGQVLIASDQQRLGAWAAAGRMFLDQPLIGQGFRAYRQLSAAFGDPVLNAPHNEWLRLFAEHGVFIGLLGLAFLGATAASLARAPGWLGAGLFASFLSLAIAATFNNVFLFNQVTIPAMVMAGTGVALARHTTPAVREDV